MAKSPILDQFAQPFQKNGTNGHGRQAVIDALQLRRDKRKPIQASYDGAADTDDLKNYWANADRLDADSANSRLVRGKLVSRSRYETANNGFVDGIIQTFATDLVGVGPALNMKSDDEDWNKEVESEWKKWAKAVHFRRKLLCMAQAKPQDGESLAVIRPNAKVRHPVKIDFIPFETEQCQTPMLAYGEPGKIDGITFDSFGNPEFYDVLPHHPGGQFGWMTPKWNVPEQIPAKFMLHWFALRRPGQHRGVPEFRSTLNVGANARRFREATIGAAEIAADFAVLLKSTLPPQEDEASPLVGSTAEIRKKMMTVLPDGFEPTQMRAEHPNSNYEQFNDSLIGEMARPKSMPRNKSLCNSSGYNYSSARMDLGTYYAGLDVERQDCDDLVLDPLFGVWFEQAALVFGWDADPRELPEHTWDWPEHPAPDPQATASADDTQLKNGSVTLDTIYARRGEDYEDQMARGAKCFSVTVDELKQRLFNVLLPLPAPTFPNGKPMGGARGEGRGTSTDSSIAAYADDQARDDHGRFASGGGGGGSSAGGSASRPAQKFSVGGQTYRFSRTGPRQDTQPKTLKERFKSLASRAVRKAGEHAAEIVETALKEALKNTDYQGKNTDGSLSAGELWALFRQHFTSALAKHADEITRKKFKKYVESGADDIESLLFAMRDGKLAGDAIESLSEAAFAVDFENGLYEITGAVDEQ